MSLGAICRQVATLVGVGPYDVWTGNVDTSAVETVAWVNEAQQRIAAEYPWAALVRDGAAPYIATAEQTLTMPADLSRILPGTVWLQGARQEVAGPLAPEEWASTRYRPAMPPVFTMGAGGMILRQSAGPGLAVFRYIATVPDYASDAAVSALGAGMERLVMLCAVALYRDAKGLPAGSAGAQYLSALAQAKSWDQPMDALQMGRRAPRGWRWRDGVTVIP